MKHIGLTLALAIAIPTTASAAVYDIHLGGICSTGWEGGKGGGYLWRLNSYWRFEERDGGVYLECESVSLTRDIPFGLGWAVGPFVTSLPRESLEFTLDTTRKTLMKEARLPQSGG